MRRLSPLVVALASAVHLLSACDEKREPSSRPRAVSSKYADTSSVGYTRGERPASSGSAQELVATYQASEGWGVAAPEEAFNSASVLFDGSARRSTPDFVASASPGDPGWASSRAGLKTVTFTAPQPRREGGDGEPPLPDFDGDYGGTPDPADDDGGGPTLLGFMAYQVEQKFPSVAPVMSRLGWKAAKRRGTATPHTPYRVTVHHTQSPRPMTEAETARIVKNIQSYHMRGRGKQGLDNFDDIGYHFLIAGDGRVVEGRRAEVLGAHARGANDGNIGISVMGDFNKMKPTGEQVESLTRLVTYLSLKYRKDPLAKGFLEPHQRYDPTDCPGSHLLGILDALRARIDERAGTALASSRGTFTPLAVLGS